MEQISFPRGNLPKIKILGVVVILLILVVVGFYYLFFQRIKKVEEELKSARELLTSLQAKLQPLPEKLREEITETIFSQGAQEIGGLAENLKIKSIRFGSHPDFLRMVFDIEKLDGSESDKIPQTKANYLKEEKAIEIEISGLGGNLSENPTIEKEIAIKEKPLISYSGKVGGEKSVKYKILLEKESSFSLDSRLSPARIILDIKK